MDIGLGDVGNAFQIDLVGGDLRAEGEGGQERQFVRGVIAFNVKCRIGFGIAKPLRVREAGFKRQALLLHAGEDIVAGAVENAEHAGDCIAGQRLAHDLDDRNAARDRRFEIQQQAFVFGDRCEPHAKPASSALLAVTTWRPAFSAALTVSSAVAALAADQFDEDVNVGGRGQFDRIIKPVDMPRSMPRSLASCRARRRR